MVIEGRIVRLRPATRSDRQAIYQWLARSDVTPSMIGPPTFPEVPAPSWGEFVADYSDSFFDHSAPEREGSYIIQVAGEDVGQVNYAVNSGPPGVVELDIWMRSESATGHGWGSDALDTLVRHLCDTMGAHEFVIRPSARNPRAIRAYEKAGFVLVPMTAHEQTDTYGAGDYADTVVLRRSCEGPTGGEGAEPPP